MATGWVRTGSWADTFTDSPPLKRHKESSGSPTIEDIFRSSSAQSAASSSNIVIDETKVFNDSVHGPIALEPLLVSIIDTPQFQRLRDVKQLGASYWVYPGASHNRFEHCLGTSHLCGVMLKTLRDRHARGDDVIEITETEMLCVKVAGLCHDLGHGPFSHVYDMKYLKWMDSGNKWEHEEGSCAMFDYMLKSNPHVSQKFEEYGLGDQEKEMIKDMIRGMTPGKDQVHQKCLFKGKEYPKWYLYEIVSNKRNGIDCDKFDYFMRDCRYVGVKSNFDCLRYFQNVRIMPIDLQLQVCVRDKEVFNLYELYHTRWSLHHRVYQHKTTKIIEQMLVEALSYVDEELGISAAINDPAQFTGLTDSIVYEILRAKSTSDNFKRSKDLLTRIQHRNLYRFCGQINPGSTKKLDNTPSQEVFSAWEIIKDMVKDSEDFDEDDVFIDIVKINFGMKDKNPIRNVTFYDKKGNPLPIEQHHISEMLPGKFQEQYLRAYAKNPAKKEAIEKSFGKWCEDAGYEIPQLLVGGKDGYFTDVAKKQDEKDKYFQERQKNAKFAKRSLDAMLKE